MSKKVEPFLDFFIKNKHPNYYASIFLDKSVTELVLDNMLFSKDGNKKINLRENEIVLKLKLKNEFYDNDGYLDPGVIITFIDSVTSFIITALDEEHRHSVSVDLSIKVLSKVKNNENEFIYVVCLLESILENKAFTSITVYGSNNLKRIFFATHTKHIFDHLKMDVSLLNDVRKNKTSNKNFRNISKYKYLSFNTKF